MKFNDRNYALLGIPDLPINAFKHIGDRKIKPQGGVSSVVKSVGNIVSAPLKIIETVAKPVVKVAEKAVSSVSKLGSNIDDAVNKEIPGGWATVAAVTAAAVGVPGLPVGGTTAATTAGTTAATTAGTGAALSPYAAQAAGAYGGSAAAAQAAAAGSLAGIQAASTAQNALNLGIPTGGAIPNPAPNQVAAMPTNQISPLTPEVSQPNISGAMSAGQTPYSAAPAITAATVGQVASSGLLDSLGSIGSSALDFAKANPSLTGSLLGAGVSALGALNAPKEQTATTSIDPQIKAEYLANLERAKTTATGLTARQFEGFTPSYLLAETQAQNLGLGGAGQRTTDEATRLAMIEAGFTPQQIQAAQANRQNIQNTTGQLGSQYMSAYQNPFEEQVVQGALGDIERARLMQEQSNRAQAISARAFGGSRQGVVSGMTNEAALRQAATTGAQLRQAGFSAAAQLGQSDAARQLQAQMANQGVDISIEQANAQLRQQAALANQGAFAQGSGIRQAAIGQLGQLGAQQQNLGLTGANAVMEAQMRQQALAQARLDAARNLGTERLAITSGALGLQPANTGGTTTQPLYSSTTGSLLSGGLTGAYIGSLLGK